MKMPLNKKTIAAISKKCHKCVELVKRETATEAALYLINFGYHAALPSGPNGHNGSGWSLYYAANWNCSVGSVDRNVITPERDPFNEPFKSYEGEWGNKVQDVKAGPFKQAKDDLVLYVTNSVYYGEWLNSGGIGFLTHESESQPNRFIELCDGYLRGCVNDIVREVKGML